jgi:ADP-ribose pyrophosphatase YjhB (NUDIX family)
VLRSSGDVLEVAMIRTRNLKDEQVWTLPKGMREDGESGEDAARREVREETGLDAEIVQPLEPITYWFVSTKDKARFRKTVYLYLMRETGGDISGHDGEVDEVRFVPLDDAPALATYPTDRKTLRAVADAASAP